MNRGGYILLVFLFFIPILNSQAAVPLLINYQGMVKDATGAAVNADGFFKFAIVDQAGTTAYWVNNGTVLDGSEPPNAVIVPVTNGRFLVKLGDNTNLTNMLALTEPVFDDTAVYLRVWFSLSGGGPYELFTPDTQIISTGFAVKSATADRALVADEVTNIDPTQIQSRISDSCTGGDTISAINQDGTVICEVDDGEVYTAGNGISISLGTISIVDGGIGDAQISGVSWGKVQGVPADIADGDQVGITTELDPSVPASIKDGIDWSELTGVPADIADGDQVGITTELDPSVPASIKDGISWSELTGIPAGFADGIDDVGTGGSLWSQSGTTAYYNLGNVGIGTASTGIIAGSSQYLSIATSGPYDPSSITSIEIAGNSNAGNSPHAKIDFLNPIGLSGAANTARIEVRTSGGSTAQGQMLFYTNGGTLDERMRITQVGNIGISNASPNVALDVTGSIEYTGSITAVSDERLKENILPIESALEKIKAINGVSYNMIDSPSRRVYGVIAQNIQSVIPEAVSIVDPENGYLGVSYPSLIPVLIEAIKEQQKQIEELNSRLSQLQ